jgi:hypothetical protein
VTASKRILRCRKGTGLRRALQEGWPSNGEAHPDTAIVVVKTVRQAIGSRWESRWMLVGDFCSAVLEDWPRYGSFRGCEPWALQDKQQDATDCSCASLSLPNEKRNKNCAT